MSVIDWLLEGDPAIRWQVLRDLTGASPARWRLREPCGARGLGRAPPRARGSRRPLGGAAPASRRLTPVVNPGSPGRPRCTRCRTLQLLGLDPASESARRAIALVAENGRWEHAGQRYFDGEVEPCINGRTVETGAYFGVDVAAIVERILAGRLDDGRLELRGRERIGAILLRHDDHVLDAYSSSNARPAGPRKCARPGPAVRSTCLSAACSAAGARGRVAVPAYLEFAFPYYWHYDVLRALDYFRRSGADPDPRMAEAVAVVRSKRAARRPVAASTGSIRVTSTSTLRAARGRPSRWNTLRALRVLEWWDGTGLTPQPRKGERVPGRPVTAGAAA